MPPEVVVLVSVGRHPVSRRARRSDLDARALGLALGCSPGATALFAGDVQAAMPVLRDYLGMGAAELIAIECGEDADPLPALEAYLRTNPPRLIFAGARCEAGEGSGLTPFWLAERLGYAVATNLVAVELHGSRARLTQAMPGGPRRRLEAELPLVATVEATAPKPHAVARMQALRRAPRLATSQQLAPDDRAQWVTKPSRPRPKRLAAPTAIGEGTEGRRELLQPDPDAAADAILDFLAREGLLGRD